MPVLPRTFARERRASGPSSVPLRPATASEARNGGPDRPGSQAARSTPTSAAAVRRSSDDRPGAVDDPDAVQSGSRPRASPRARPGRRRRSCPTPPVERPELLQHHLGGEVVAVAVHRADDHGERRGGRGRSGRRPSAPSEPGAAGDCTPRAASALRSARAASSGGGLRAASPARGRRRARTAVESRSR